MRRVRQRKSGIIIAKEVVVMKITGTDEEIKWILNSLSNTCENCPFTMGCEELARKDLKECGEVRKSCMDYLRENIKLDAEDNDI